MGSRTFAGFTDETPLTLRFDHAEGAGDRREDARRGIFSSYVTPGTRTCLTDEDSFLGALG